MPSRLYTLPDEIQSLIWKTHFQIVLQELRARALYNSILHQLEHYVLKPIEICFLRHYYLNCQTPLPYNSHWLSNEYGTAVSDTLCIARMQLKTPYNTLFGIHSASFHNL